MRSIFFEIWTSNEVQSMLRFFIKFWKFQEIKPNKPFSGSFSEVFQLHRLLRSIFSQMTGLVKIRNRVEFYEYNILDCQVINFRSSSYQFSIYEMPLFGEVVGSSSPKYFQILLKFPPQLVFKETKIVL